MCVLDDIQCRQAIPVLCGQAPHKSMQTFRATDSVVIQSRSISDIDGGVARTHINAPPAMEQKDGRPPVNSLEDGGNAPFPVIAQGPRLEGLKMTGDPNVPAGHYSVVADADAVTVGRYDGAEADVMLSRPIGAAMLPVSTPCKNDPGFGLLIVFIFSTVLMR